MSKAIPSTPPPPVVDVATAVRRIEAMMTEAVALSIVFERAMDNHPSMYAMNRAWRALEEARNKAGTGGM